MPTQLDDRQIVNRAALAAIGSAAGASLDVIMSDINALFAAATYLPTASVLMSRDANANTQANNFLEGFQTTATAAGTTTLTVSSKYFQQFTGTTTQTVVLPVATTLTLGQSFCIANRSTGYLTVNANGGGLIQSMAPNTQATVTVTSVGTSAGTWDSAYSTAGVIPFLQTAVLTDATTTGTAATLQTGDILDGVVRLTNSSLVSVSGIPAGASGQSLIIENQTGNTITLNNNDSGATAANRIYSGTGGPVTMAANASFAFTYDTTVSRWMLTGGTGSGSGSGGSKNYLSAITASTASGVPNAGNGNFELGSTAGWSLAHSALTSSIPSSVATAGVAFSSSSGGSAASGSLSLTTVISGTQISGTTSGSLVSSAASTAGDMLVSSAFFIDKEDQAKVLTFKAYYQAATVGGLNFSGTSSNGFAAYIYDVTNGAWIQPAGVYGMTQNTGVGYITGTFQTTSNSTQYQIAFVNINASTGAYTLYLDDITVGPQTAPIGPVVTDWQTFTPTGSWTTNSTYSGRWRRVGDSAEYEVFVSLAGAPNSTSLNINLVSSHVIDTSKITSTQQDQPFGISKLFVASGGMGGITRYISPTLVAPQAFFNPSGTTVQTTDITPTVPGTFASGNFVWCQFKVPIVGWSSNVQMSNDTDTRVVAMKSYKLSGNHTVSGSYQAISAFTATDVDTHSVFNATTGIYTVPVSGDYLVNATVSFFGNVTGIRNGQIVQNSTVRAFLSVTPGQATLPCTVSGATIMACVAGDTISLTGYQNSGGTLSYENGNNYATTLSIQRLSGPSVIAATESVNMRYTDTSGAAIGTSLAAFSFTTKNYDSHGVYSGSTYTVPVSGKWAVKAAIYTSAVNLSTSQVLQIAIYRNGSIYSNSVVYGSGVSVSHNVAIADSISCLAGDTLQIFVLSGVATTATAGAAANWIAIERIGN